MGKSLAKLKWENERLYKELGLDKRPIIFFKEMPFIPFKGLQKKLEKLAKRYEAAEGKPLLQARILRAGVAVEAKLEKLKRLAEVTYEQDKNDDRGGSSNDDDRLCRDTGTKD